MKTEQTFGQWLRDKLASNKVTQAELAELAGTSRQHIGNMVRGQRHRLHTDDYYLINQNTGEAQECQTIATVELKRGKPALYRGIVVKV